MGAVLLIRRRGKGVAAMLFIPILVAILASRVRRYPAAPRLMLFIMPLMTTMLCEGIGVISAQPRTLLRVPWLAVASAALLVLPGLDAVRQWAAPLDRESLRPLVRRIERELQPGAVIYVFGRAMPAWLFYTTDRAHPDLDRVHRRSVLIGSTGGAFYHAASRGHAMMAERDSFSFAYRDWRELVGVPAGLGPDSLGIRRDAPDPGWAANEARRIRVAGGPEAWLVRYRFR